jgi:hypothetical protein
MTSWFIHWQANQSTARARIGAANASERLALAVLEFLFKTLGVGRIGSYTS